MALRIGPRITAASLIVLALLGAVSTISVTTLDDLGRNFETYRETSRDGVLAASLQSSIMNVRLNVKEFLLTGSREDEQQVRTFLRDTDALVAEADREIHNPERRRHHEAAKAALKSYQVTFDRVVDLEQSLAKLRTERLDANGPRVEKALSSIMQSAHEDGDVNAAFNAGEAMRSLLLARLYVQKRLDRHDLPAADRVRQEFADFEREHTDLLGQLENPERRRLAAEASTAFEGYKGAFEEAVRIAAETDRQIEKELNPAGASILAAVDAIRTSLATEQEQVGERATAQITASETETTVLAIAALLLGLGAAWLIGRSITRPVKAMTETMVRLARGDTSISVPSLNARDEVGDMARAVEVFKANAVEAERLRWEQEAARERAEEERRKALQDMADTVEREAGHAVKVVAGRTTRMAQGAEGMAGSAERVSLNAQSVAAAADQALANAQTVATATEELSTSIREIAGQVAHSTAVTRQAVEDGRETRQTIQSLSEAVGRIGEVASLIGDIAGQTNLLALNATIEAARAGEAGKGFAVVASEVKNLANQTARSTEEISRQITEIQTVTATAVTAVEGIGQTIGEIDGISSMIAAAMEEQAAATQEISRNVVETTHAAQEVSRRIAVVSQEATDTGEQAAHVREDSGGVADSILALQQTLVRVVRTSTKDADRRRKPRYRLNEPCTLQVGGVRHTGTIRNMSEDGALVESASSLAPGARGALSLDHHGLRVEFEVRSAGNEQVHLNFTSGQDVALQDGFARITRGMTPLDTAA